VEEEEECAGGNVSVVAAIQAMDVCTKREDINEEK
jgi:hypothetical protein